MSIKPDAKFEHELIQEYEDGECIFSEGDSGRELYIIQSGHVAIRKNTAHGTIEIAKFAKGDFFGDISLLQSVPRYAGAYSVGKTRLLILKPAGFLIKIRRDPTFAFEMLQQMSYRVLVSNNRLLALVEQFQLPADEVQKIIAHIGEKM